MKKVFVEPEIRRYEVCLSNNIALSYNTGSQLYGYGTMHDSGLDTCLETIYDTGVSNGFLEYGYGTNEFKKSAFDAWYLANFTTIYGCLDFEPYTSFISANNLIKSQLNTIRTLSGFKF